MVRRISLLLTIILTVSLVFASCKPMMGESEDLRQEMDSNYAKNKDDIMDNGPVRRGTLKLFTTTPDTLNPIFTSNVYVQNFSNLIFEGLVKLDKSQKPVPVLADRWEVSSDGLIWTFYLKDNILWHDNMPLASEDVEFTLSAILNPGLNSVYKKNIENVSTFAAVDRKTFRIILKKPDSFTPERMTFPILPKHYFMGENLQITDRNMRPVGTGPYKFQEYAEKSGIKLIMNDKWWNAKNADKSGIDLPYIHDIEIKVYGSIKDAISAFQTRDVDISTVQSGECSKYSGRSDLTLKKYTGNNYEYIAFNLSNRILMDKTVRQAIAQAIDKSAVINDVMPGEAIASDLPLIPDTWLFDTNIINYTPSQAKAREMLLKDGWKEKNEVLQKVINGIMTPLNLEILVNDDNETRYRAAVKISEQLKAAGINLQVKSLAWDEEMKVIGQRKFDMVLIGCTVPSIPDISFMYSTSEIATGRNIAGYSNADVDSYLDKIRLENDASLKKAQFINMKSIINDELPYIGLCFLNNAVLYNKKVRGEMNPYQWDILSDLTRWYIPIG